MSPIERKTRPPSLPHLPENGPEQQNAREGEGRVVNIALQGGGSHGAFAWGGAATAALKPHYYDQSNSVRTVGEAHHVK